MRIIYLCPAQDTPTGGVKVLYRHAELLASLGAETYILHPTDPDFTSTWFDHRAPVLRQTTLYLDSDFIIIPELWAALYGPECIDQRLRFAIFVQGPYIYPDQSPELFRRIYQAAALVLTISEDCGRMVALNYPGIHPDRLVRVRYSIHDRFLARRDPAEEASTPPSISFMPRKLAYHAALVLTPLRQYLPPRWLITPIDNVDEATVATMLAASRVFLSFEDFGGLPMPPLEAALAGNLVIGYTGQGGREYWDAPNFQEIHHGDIQGFVMAASQAARDIDSRRLTRADLTPGIDRLAERFSVAAETENLRVLLGAIERCFASGPARKPVAEFA
jgi:hypothetical protein